MFSGLANPLAAPPDSTTTKEWLCAYLDFIMEGFWLEYFLVLSNVDQKQLLLKLKNMKFIDVKKEGTAKAWQFFYCVNESLDALVFLKKNQRKN